VTVTPTVHVPTLVKLSLFITWRNTLPVGELLATVTKALSIVKVLAPQ